MSSSKYQTLNSNEDLEKPDNGYRRPGSEMSAMGGPISLRGMLAIAAFGMAAFLSGALASYWISAPDWRTYRQFGRYESGFVDEKLLPAERIQLEQVRFKSPVDFEKNGHEVLVTEPGQKMYVGDSWDEIDAAWGELLWGRYFSLSEEEARRLWGPDYGIYWDTDRSGYTGGFDMFHQLHCLNQIRQALHRDIYPETPIHGMVHTEHCIDHLRQAIMCWGSTSVVPLKYFEGYGHPYVKSDAMHTCRKFEPIREYVSERFNGTKWVPRPSGYYDMEANAF